MDPINSFLAVINNYRAQNGAEPLQISSSLTSAAQWLANDMAAKNYLSHTDSQGRSPFDRMDVYGYPTQTYRGENIAAGPSDAQSVFDQWQSACDLANGVCSYAHRANMLNPNFKAIGIARVYNPNSQFKYYWATDFGGIVDTPAAAQPTPQPTPQTTFQPTPQPTPQQTPQPTPQTTFQPTQTTFQPTQTTFQPAIQQPPQTTFQPTPQPTPQQTIQQTPQPTPQTTFQPQPTFQSRQTRGPQLVPLPGLAQSVQRAGVEPSGQLNYNRYGGGYYPYSGIANNYPYGNYQFNTQPMQSVQQPGLVRLDQTTAFANVGNIIVILLLILTVVILGILLTRK